MTFILGISAFYHDSAAAIVKDGEIIAAAQEERFTRKKHDSSFPSFAIKYCLDEVKIKLDEVDHIIFYDKPLLKFERLLETYLSSAPVGFRSFMMAMPVWLKEKLYLKTLLRNELAQIEIGTGKFDRRVLFAEHHQSHAASAFFPSPFAEAAVLCMDGVGEWATTSIWVGEKNILEPVLQLDFPHSLGLLYSAFTYFTGFKVNSGEYKLMGLAPYGKPKYTGLILDRLLDLKEDGSFRMDMSYFNYITGLTMTNDRFSTLFDGPPRKPESEVTQREMDIAASIQHVTEEIVLRLSRTARRVTGKNNLCLAGGVALNCVANGKLLKEKIFDDIWIQPAAGDAGGAVGSALSVWYQYLNQPRYVNKHDGMSGAYLGPSFSNKEITSFLAKQAVPYEQYEVEEIITTTAKLLSEGNVVGWYHGRMEFGPRALGNRSILGDPRNKSMQSKMNLKIKYRESFRPFAPSIIAERIADYFDINHDSPYMLLVADVNNEIRIEMTESEKKLFGIDQLNIARSSIPAVTHVDYSARIQSVHHNTNPRYYALLKAFESLTGCPVLINTSFNVRGEPIVCSPEDAYRCFMRTEMDYLVMENCLLTKKDQPSVSDNDWKQEYSLD